MIINTKKVETKITFLNNELYPKVKSLNRVYREAGLISMFHDFSPEAETGLTEQYPDAVMDAAHKIVTRCDVCGDLTISSRLRNATTDVNAALREASLLGIRLNIDQQVDFLDPDLMPSQNNPDDKYTGRWSIILQVEAPNIDDVMIEETVTEEK